jgi:cysteinyl-tRNA synthetase
VCTAFGLVLVAVQDVPADIAAKAAALDSARAAKDFARADALRDELKAAGWTVETSSKGTVVRR